MKEKLKIISLGVFCLIVFLSCKTARVEYSSDKFIVVETVAGDSFEGLAAKYLKDPDKDWLITEFNKTRELKQGENIIVPLAFFNKGGLKANGCQVVPVLNYRGFTLKAIQGEQKVSEIEFRKQMLFLQENGYRVISTGSFLDFIDYKIQIPEKSVVITITGDANSFYEIAFPVLESFGYETTLFIDPEMIDNNNEKTWARVRELLKKGVDIQTFAGLSGVMSENNNGTIEDYFFNIEGKIAKSKKDIENKVGKKCTLYASPMGKDNNILTNLLIKNGYKAAFINSNEGNPFFVDKFEINSTVIDGGLMIDEFRKKVTTFQHMDLN